MRGILAGLLLLLVAGAAHATTFDFSYTGNGVAGSGSVTADLIAPGEYVAVSGTDTAVGGGVNGVLTLLPNPVSPSETYSPSGYFIYDSLLFLGSNPDISNGGWLFTNGSGGELNIFSNGPSDYVDYDNTGFNVSITFEPVPAPEPATLSVLMAGMACLVCTRRRKRV